MGRCSGRCHCLRRPLQPLMAAVGMALIGLGRRWPIPTAGDALKIGASWLALTVAFEFGFWRAVAKQSWQQLLADYNLAEGRTWPLVLAWIAFGPSVVRELQAA